MSKYFLDNEIHGPLPGDDFDWGTVLGQISDGSLCVEHCRNSNSHIKS